VNRHGLYPAAVLQALTLVLIGSWAVGCGHSGAPAINGPTNEGTVVKPSEQQQADLRVALIMKTLTNPFFVAMEKGARKVQRETHIDLQVETATQETSIEQQVQLVETEIKAKAKAIIIAPGDSMRLVPALKKAQDAGIQIVNIDNRLSATAMAEAGMKPVPFISVDNEAGAFQAAKFIADQIHQPTEAAVLEGIRTANNAQLRKHGAERGFRTNPGIRIVAEETANWKIDEAYTVTRALFKSHPRIGVLFCANDMMAIGAIKYLQEAGKTRVLVAGFDALDEAKAAIKAGTMAVTVDQQADQQGYLGVESALKLLRGEKVPMDLQVEVRLITAADLR
jgi:ribose transport system substrate-binding protein